MKRFLSLFVFVLSTASLRADYWRWVQKEDSPGHTYYYADSLDYGAERYAYLGVHDAGGVLAVSADNKNDDSTAWHLIPTGDISPYTLQPTYYIRNVGTGRYISGVGRTSKSESRAWNWVFYPANADTLYRGYPTICHFVEDGDTLLGRPIMESDYAGIDLNNIFPILYEHVVSHYVEFERLRDSLQSDGKAVESFYMIGNETGHISPLLFDELKNSVELIKNLGPDLDDDEYVVAMARFYRAKAAADSATSHLDEGFYQIIEAQMGHEAFLFSPNDGLLHLALNDKHADSYQLTGHGYPMCIFHLQKQSNEHAFSLQCLYDSLYWQPASSYNESVQMVATRPAAPLFAQHRGKGELYIYSHLQSGYNVAECHYMPTTKGNDLIESSRTSMRLLLRPVETGNTDSLCAAALQTRLDVHLAALLDTARRQLQQAAVYEGDSNHNDVVMAAQELQHVVEQAATVPPRQSTPADVNTLQAALNSLRLIWPDTMQLEALSLKATELEANASIGTGIGQCRQSAIDSLSAALCTTTALRPYARLRRSAIDSAAAQLAVAIEAFQQNINLPLTAESYFIVSASDSSMHGRCIVTRRYESGRLLSLEGTPRTNEQNALAAWQFIPMGERGVYAVRNLASGHYLGPCSDTQLTVLSDTPAPYRLRLVGKALIGLQGENDELLLCHGNGTPHGKNRFIDNEQAWTLQAVDHERMTDIKYLHPQAAQVVCVPYTTTQLPTSLYADMQWYEPIGLQAETDGRITGLALRFTDDESLCPGKPYILVMGSSTEGSNDLAVDMCLDVDNPQQDTLLTSHAGLHGTLRSLTFTSPGYAFFSLSDTLHFSTKSDEIVLSPHEGYFKTTALQPARSKADFVLPVEPGHTLADLFDHNGDGRVGLADALVIINRVASSGSNDILQLDHNDDGFVGLPDALILLQQISGE